MKFLTAIISVFLISNVFAFTEEQLKIADKIAEFCVEETGANPEDVRKLRAYDFSVNNGNLQCFAKCFLEKTGFMIDGEINEETVVEQLTFIPVDKIHDLLSACKDLKGKDDCEKAFNAYKCYGENNHYLTSSVDGLQSKHHEARAVRQLDKKLVIDAPKIKEELIDKTVVDCKENEEDNKKNP